MAGKHRDGKHVRNVKKLLTSLARQHGVEVTFFVGEPHYGFDVTLNGKRRRGSYTKNSNNEVRQLAYTRQHFERMVSELKRETSK